MDINDAYSAEVVEHAKDMYNMSVYLHRKHFMTKIDGEVIFDIPVKRWKDLPYYDQCYWCDFANAVWVMKWIEVENKRNGR